MKNTNGQSIIQQGIDGQIQNSLLDNAVTNLTGLCEILQGIGGEKENIQNSLINNAVQYSTGITNIMQDYNQGNVSDCKLFNWILGSENTTITQNNTLDTKINNSALFSTGTSIIETNLTGVNACVIAIGCDGFTKP